MRPLTEKEVVVGTKIIINCPDATKYHFKPGIITHVGNPCTIKFSDGVKTQVSVCYLYYEEPKVLSKDQKTNIEQLILKLKKL